MWPVLMPYEGRMYGMSDPREPSLMPVLKKASVQLASLSFSAGVSSKGWRADAAVVGLSSGVTGDSGVVSGRPSSTLRVLRATASVAASWTDGRGTTTIFPKRFSPPVNS